MVEIVTLGEERQILRAYRLDGVRRIPTGYAVRVERERYLVRLPGLLAQRTGSRGEAALLLRAQDT